MLIQNGSRSENWQQRVGTVRGADQYWTNYRLRTCLGGNNLPLWESGKDTAIFCLAWVPALLAHPSVTCSTVVKPNPLEKRKQVQLLPKSMHLRHLQPSPKRWWEAWSTALQTCLNMADIMDGETPTAKPFTCCFSLKNAYEKVQLGLSAGISCCGREEWTESEGRR